MKKLVHVLKVLVIVALALSAQPPMNLQMQTPAPASPFVSAFAQGNPGNASFNYYVVATYPSGTAVSQPALVQFAQSTQTSGNPVNVGWAALAGATSYDVLKLVAPLTFTGSCTCSIATGLTTTSYRDTGGGLSLYTLAAGAVSGTGTLYVNTRDYSGPQVRQVLNGVDSAIGVAGPTGGTGATGAPGATGATGSTGATGTFATGTAGQFIHYNGSGSASGSNVNNLLGVPATGINLPVARVFGSAVGHNNVYTVPAGKYAFIASTVLFANTGVASGTGFCEISHSSTYYQLALASTSVAVNASLNYNCGGFIMLSGDILSMNTSVAGFNAVFFVVEYDSATALLVPFWQFGLTSGNNTIVTVPAATAVTPGFVVNVTIGGFVFTGTGGSQTINQYLVPTGQTIGAPFLIFAVGALGSSSRNNLVAGQTAATAGDRIVINTTLTDAGTVVHQAYILQPTPLVQ